MTIPPYTIGSLFSGVGGLELGLEQAGLGPVVWQAECDPHCRAVLARHWPTARRYADVREIDEHNTPRVDVICGGFPCQDVSIAGKGAGLAGARSGLWHEFARIVRALRPRYVVVENVAALVGRGLDRVLGDLAACGYDARWSTLRAADVGAPHRRDRLFLVAQRVSDADGVGVRQLAERRERESAERRDAEPIDLGEDVAHAECLGLQRLAQARPTAPAALGGSRTTLGWPPGPNDSVGWRRWLDAGGPAPVTGEGRLAPEFVETLMGFPVGWTEGASRRQRIRMLGNAVVPACALMAWRELSRTP